MYDAKLKTAMVVGLAVLAALAAGPVHAQESDGGVGATPEAQVAPIACLDDIVVIRRPGVTLLQFQFSGAVEPKVRREEQKTVMLFPVAANCLAEHRLDPPAGLPFGSVELKQRTHEGSEWLGAIVTLADQCSSSVILGKTGRTVSLIVAQSEQTYGLWSARGGQFVQSDLVVAPEPVAVAEPEPAAPAVTQSAESTPLVPEVAVVAETTFTVKGYLVASGDNVNVRSSPAVDAQNVVARLARGESVALLEERKGWKRIQTGDNTRGWVNSSLVATRSEVPVEVAQASTPANVQPRAVTASVLPALGAVAAAMAGQPPANVPIPSPSAPPPAAVSSNPSATVDAVATLTGPSRADSVILPPAARLVQYTNLGRDPFVPYSRKIDEGLPTVDNLQLVGILYDQSDRIALLQDEMFLEKSYALREHEAVSGGTVWRITANSVIFLVTELGISRTITLELPAVSPTTVQSKRGKT